MSNIGEITQAAYYRGDANLGGDYTPLPTITPRVIFNFLKKFEKSEDSDGCWIWGGWVKDRGRGKEYGVVSINGKRYAAHRIAYKIHNKVDPKELHVLHKCDNHRCVNPQHLFLGTNEDNIADKVSKGRQMTGGGWTKPAKSLLYAEKNPAAKLTKVLADDIRVRYKNGGISLQELAKGYSVSKKAILNIVQNKTYAN